MNQPLSPHDLLRRLHEDLSPPAHQAIEACETICRERNLALYLVGGAVRDLLLGRRGFDIDLALAVDVADIAEALAAATGGRAVIHSRFGTAAVTGRGFRLDLARTRRESYAQPGALPQVEPASLAEDLARRDFTINAVALRLAPDPPELIDPYRGLPDAQSSLLRVLHEASFQDDATRMLRAVRYASRLDFKVARQTEALIRRDLPYFGTISGPRLRRELSLIFHEHNAEEGALLADNLGALHAIHPALGLTRDVAGRWQAALEGARHAPLDELGFCILANPADDGTAASVSTWLHLTGRIEAALSALMRLKSQAVALASMRTSPSEAIETLDGVPPAAIWALSVLDGGDAGETCRAYLEVWRNVRPALTGDDLLALGMRPGPEVGRTLRVLRAGRLEGRITKREHEIDLVHKALS